MTTTKKIAQGIAIAIVAFTLSACADSQDSVAIEKGKVATKQQVKAAGKTYNIIVTNEVKAGEGGQQILGSAIAVDDTITRFVGTIPKNTQVTRDALYAQHAENLKLALQGTLTEAGMSQQMARHLSGKLADEIMQDIKEVKLTLYTNISDSIKSPVSEHLGTIWDFSNQQTLGGVLDNDAWH